MTSQREHRDRLIAVNTEAHRYYREQLLTSPGAQGPCRYLTQRRLAHVLAVDSPWPVGYAPAGWTNLIDHLHEAGFTSEEVIAAGVACRTRKGGVIDRFRDRIMLAQHNHHGDIVGFIGRAAPGAPSDAPKYLNSPHTDIYNKRELLFGLHEQREALAHGASPVLVEGTLDVLAIAATDVEASPRLAGVAPCGTALTAEQVALLTHHTTHGAGVVVAYDNDETGRKAASAAYGLLGECRLLSSRQLMAAELPRGADPAEVHQIHGTRALHHALTDPRRLVPLGQHAIETELRAWTHVLDGAEGRIAAVGAVAPLVAKLPGSAVAEQVAHLAERVSLDPTTVTIALTDALANAEPAKRGRCNQFSDPDPPLRVPSGHTTTRTPFRHVL
jgi:DNA primase catalytic core